MVLINNLTIDEINAALLHLQRSQGEIVGGTKGNTINNISVTQQGGGGYTPDFSSAIKNLEKRVDTLDVKTEQNQQSIAGQFKINVTQKDQISDLYNLVNNLRSSQITELFFDEDTRVLTLATTDTRYDVPLPSEEVSLTFDSTSNKLVFTMGEQTKEVTLPYINASEKGAANGVATLDATGRVPYSQLPESAMEFKGEWNADTNTPELKDGHGTNGDFYICNVGGTANFGTSQNPRTITFYVNDRVIYQGNVAQWKRLPASEVRTVNGQSGDVTLNGTNVNYSDANNSPTLKDKIDTVEGYAKTQSDWGQTNTSAIDFIKNKPSLATVATSGSYNDLSNKPTIPAAQIQSDWTQTNSSSKDFIKNKIPIWITSGSADDNMSPIDSVTNGSMRPVTSNAVYEELQKYEETKIGQGYSLNTYTSGYYKLCEVRSFATAANHDVAIFGKIMFSLAADALLNMYDFTLCSRYQYTTHAISKFVVAPIDKNNNTPPFRATRKVLSNGTIIVAVYGQITGYWERFYADIEMLFVGDMYVIRKLNSDYLTIYNNNYVASIPSDETVITRT